MTESFKLHVGNRLEDLAALLGENLAAATGDPFSPGTVVVQNRGTALYLQRQLGRQLGICANLEFPFLNAFVEAAMLLALPREFSGDFALFRREALMFAIYRELMALPDRPEFDAFRRYLGADNRRERARQLAGVLARSFDQYQIFRPEEMLKHGPPQPDQRLLWQAVAGGRSGRSGLFAAFFALKRAPEIARRHPRIAVFGVSSMPPLYLWFFQKLAEFTEVDFYYLNPCREEWSFALPPERKTPLRQLTDGAAESELEAEFYSEEFNPLLISLGGLGREFFAAMLAAADYGQYGMVELFRDPAAARRTMLGIVQQDILDGVNRREPEEIDPADDSIRIVDCHHPMREVEILHDELLRRFNADDTLLPGEVIVLAPDIGGYVPYIQAVFGAIPADDRRYIPWSVADCAAPESATVFEGFFALCRCTTGRFTPKEIVNLLDHPPIRAAFAFSEEEFELLPQLLKESGIAWGIDDAHRREVLEKSGEAPSPAFAGHSWRTARDRLFLGFAAAEPADGRPRLTGGILPLGRLDGERGGAAAKLELFLDRLFALKASFAACRTLEDLRRTVLALLTDFFAELPTCRPAVQKLREEFGQLLESARLAGLEDRADPAVILPELENRLAGLDHGGGFLRGGVTFCDLQPMRSIPHRVVAILGLNQGAFPRRRETSTLDLIWKHPRRGDRSARLEDRYLFLEALLSARDALILSYAGQSVSDNGELPPSPVLSEVLTVLRRSFHFSGDDPAPYFKRHPLQPFNPVYFTPGSGLFSYAPDAFAAAETIAAGRPGREPVFLAAPLPEPAEPPEPPGFQLYGRFFRHPFRYFCRQVLQLADTLDDTPELTGAEPLEPDGLVRHRLKGELLQAMAAGGDGEDAAAVARAEGIVPPPPFGEFFLESLSADAGQLLDEPREALANRTLRQFGADPEFEPLPAAWHTHGVSAAGRVGPVLAVLADRKSDGRLAVTGRLLQIFLALDGNFASLHRIVLFGGDGGVLQFEALLPFQAERARGELEALYRAGQREPLRFLPRTSWALHTGGNYREAYAGSRYAAAERDDFAVRLFAPRDLEPELEIWRTVARRFFAGGGEG